MMKPNKIMFLFLFSCLHFLILKNEFRNERIERRLTEKKSKDDLKEIHVRVDSKLSVDQRKLKFFKIIKKILSKAQDENLAIKSIKLGSNISDLFKNKNIKKDLARMVNDGKLDERIIEMNEKIRTDKKKSLVGILISQKTQGKEITNYY